MSDVVKNPIYGCFTITFAIYAMIYEKTAHIVLDSYVLLSVFMVLENIFHYIHCINSSWISFIRYPVKFIFITTFYYDLSSKGIDLFLESANL